MSDFTVHPRRVVGTEPAEAERTHRRLSIDPCVDVDGDCGDLNWRHADEPRAVACRRCGGPVAAPPTPTLADQLRADGRHAP